MHILDLNKHNGFLALSYHYIRPPEESRRFPRLMGNGEDVFRRHIEMLKNYRIISMDDALNFYYGDFSFKNGKPGLLFTFDDGLSDHYLAAKILAEQGIKATFFLPTCFLADKEPANPVIVHYCLMLYRINGFLKAYREALEAHRLDFNKYNIEFEKGKDNPRETIKKIKKILQHDLNYKDTRRILLFVYNNLLRKDNSEILKTMHLTEQQIKDILEMGHSIGTHSHSHISVAASKLGKEDFAKEMVAPKKYLEKTFNVNIEAFSYPFGRAVDCLFPEELLECTREYKLAFTLKEILNTKQVSRFELGRYMPRSEDDENGLAGILRSIYLNRFFYDFK